MKESPMTANQLLDAGRLTEAIAKLSDDIKLNPGDLRSRVFLFELLCFSGDLVRAQKQLDVITGSEADAEVAVARYRNVLAAEALRRDVFSGKSLPHISDPRPAYADLHIAALKEVNEGKPDAALALLEQAAALQNPLGGSVRSSKESIPGCRWNPFDHYRWLRRNTFGICAGHPRGCNSTRAWLVKHIFLSYMPALICIPMITFDWDD